MSPKSTPTVPRVKWFISQRAGSGPAQLSEQLLDLAAADKIELQIAEGQEPEDLAGAFDDIDIVIDHTTPGSYGELACRAMASGTAVMGYIDEATHALVGRRLPILAAPPEATIEILSEVLDDPSILAELGSAGESYAREVHDGRLTAQLLLRGMPGPNIPLTKAGVVQPSDHSRGTATSAAQLVIGPANMAGQGWNWARSLDRYCPNVSAEVMTVDRGGLDFECNTRVAADVWSTDEVWQNWYFDHVVDRASHVLQEAGRPVAGPLNGRSWAEEAALFESRGVAVAAVFHGSEIRDPATHRAQHRWSPFADPESDLSRSHARLVQATASGLLNFRGPIFVSTPDLLDYVPEATWLPVVVDTARLRPDSMPLRGPEVPVVTHIPSNTALKGTERIEAALRSLEGEGEIVYRRIVGVPHFEVADILRNSDIVLDQFAIGSYGVLACEAMALGRIVVGNVSEHVRRRLPSELPIVNAETDQISDVIRELVQGDMDVEKLAKSGAAYVEQVHNGQWSAAALSSFLG